MTTTTKSAHRAIASLMLPSKVPALITYAQGITKALTGFRGAIASSAVTTLRRR
jgi:hypothetical protein